MPLSLLSLETAMTLFKVKIMAILTYTTTYMAASNRKRPSRPRSNQGNIVKEYEVLTAANMNTAVFWVLAPCSLVEVYRRFIDTCCLHHHTLMMEAASTVLQSRRQPSSYLKTTVWISKFSPSSRGNIPYGRSMIPTTATTTAASETLLDQRREKQQDKWSAFYTTDGGEVFPHPKTCRQK
jgi:hypothetical protein